MSIINLPLNNESAAKAFRTGIGLLPTLANCTGVSPVSPRHNSVFTSNLILLEPMNTVASSLANKFFFFVCEMLAVIK